MTKIIGVDFSGAVADASTWVTQARLESDSLRLLSCQAMSRAELTGLLTSLEGGAVAALDFPFSVPQGFAEFWQPAAGAMPVLWQAAANMDYGRFLELRDRFVSGCGEPLRRGDLYFRECYSCLHKFNPNMVPMTFRGMQMLHHLWNAGCRVPPLADAGRNGPLLLESMPGAALRAYGLPYKGYKNGAHAGRLRNQVLDGLAERSGVRVANLDRYRDICLNSHDGLDSVVAAVTAALWEQRPGYFRCPDANAGPPAATGRRQASPGAMTMNELQAARLEGWIYAPVAGKLTTWRTEGQ